MENVGDEGGRLWCGVGHLMGDEEEVGEGKKTVTRASTKSPSNYSRLGYRAQQYGSADHGCLPRSRTRPLGVTDHDELQSRHHTSFVTSVPTVGRATGYPVYIH